MLAMRVILALAVLTSATAVACATHRDARPARTIPLLQVVEQGEALRGRTVRTCGTSFAQVNVGGGFRKWKLSVPMSVGWHPARIDILPCGKHEPELDEQGCITGRIARHDGSVRLPGPRELLDAASPGTSVHWALHAQCPSAGGRR